MITLILNGSHFNDWTIEDLAILINNPDYKENDTIDYKINFAFLEIDDKKISQHKKDEFRHDICSFANVDGGYMFFGISESSGVAVSLHGIQILNTDAFECRLKDIISTIEPLVPNYSIKFIQITDSYYIVVIEINKGVYKPYVNKENDCFKYYIRRGNGKACMNYEEVKSMFNKSLELTEQINGFRNNRIKMCYQKEGVASSMDSDSFALVHFITDDAFVNQNQDLVTTWLNREIRIETLFSQNARGLGCPNVDGLAFNDKIHYRTVNRYLQLFKNKTIEKYIDIEKFNKGENPILSIGVGSLCTDIKSIYIEAIRYYRSLNHTGALYACVSILNCKGCCTENDFYNDYIGIIDRNEIMCMPFEIYDIYNEEQVNKILKSLLCDLCFSIGKRKVKDICE